MCKRLTNMQEQTKFHKKHILDLFSQAPDLSAWSVTNIIGLSTFVPAGSARPLSRSFKVDNLVVNHQSMQHANALIVFGYLGEQQAFST